MARPTCWTTVNKGNGARSDTLLVGANNGSPEHLHTFCGHVWCRCSIRPTGAELLSWHWNRSRDIVHKTEAAVNQYEMLSLMLSKKRCGRTHNDRWRVRAGDQRQIFRSWRRLLFFRIVTSEGMWVYRYITDTKNSIHSIETFKIACKWGVLEKREDEKDDDSIILGYSRHHSCWFYAASYYGDCSRYKLSLQRLNSTTVTSPVCLRVLLLHTNAVYTTDESLHSWRGIVVPIYFRAPIHYDENSIKNDCKRFYEKYKVTTSIML